MHHGEKNDLVKLARAEVELLNSKEELDSAKAELLCAENTMAQMDDEKFEADRKIMTLQGKLLDANERIAKNAAVLQEKLSDTEKMNAKLEGEKVDAERERKLELENLPPTPTR